MGKADTDKAGRNQAKAWCRKLMKSQLQRLPGGFSKALLHNVMLLAEPRVLCSVLWNISVPQTAYNTS